MLINVDCQNGIQLGKKDVSPISFKELFLRESDIEEFLRKNIQLIFEEESLLIVGQQLVDTQNGRSDLVAIDGNGDLVLIEIKRDKDDIKNRKEPLELQAIRYAASFLLKGVGPS
jgi:RecB family endonuclease NucS